MAKRDPVQPPEASGAVCNWPRAARWLISGALVFHLLAVSLTPFLAMSRNSGGSESPLAAQVMHLFRPYVTALFLNHGYAFFAPDPPGESHLVKYRVEFADGRPTVQGTFPDLATERPRLLYHRHFMLAEFWETMFTPPEEPPAAPLPLAIQRSRLSADQREELEQMRASARQRQLAAWKQGRQSYESLRDAYQNHLRAKYSGERAIITRQAHLVLTPDEFKLLGRRGDLPATYVDLPEAAPPPEVIRP